MTSGTPFRAYSTIGAPSERGAALWRSYMAEVYYALDIEGGGGDHAAGSIRENVLGTIGVSSVQTNAQRVTRRKGAAAADGLDAFVLLFSRRGAYGIRQGRNAGVLEPGDAVLLDAAEYYRCDVPADSDNVTLKVPGHVLRSRLGGIDDLCATARVADRALIPIVGRFAADILSAADLDPRTAPRLEGVCIDLITTMLDAGRRASRGGRQSSDLPSVVLGDLRTFIQHHLGRPDLTADDAARRCRVSTRLVQKLFQRVGTTFGQELMSARLDRADRLLRASEGGAAADRRHRGHVRLRQPSPFLGALPGPLPARASGGARRGSASPGIAPRVIIASGRAPAPYR